ncbi:acyl carrier protein [uncultured Robinsoniella sp.]|uniref:acyl carrier protein n=1 Tax=uncultured Robinsoniella sp. TaxID=904190 RepID=UPI00374EF4B2
MLEQLKEMICEYVEVEPAEINEESRFIEDLGFNSYDFMSMVGEIEDTFDIEVEEREVVNVKTVGDAVKYIKELQEA